MAVDDSISVDNVCGLWSDESLAEKKTGLLGPPTPPPAFGRGVSGLESFWSPVNEVTDVDASRRSAVEM